ncbi:MAG: prolyl oligopeptidase family serine peptidase [Chitinophagaceae bacterium]|nr:prolyl oligopeptidase family serine peptidase [Chitinophagaceae bacterium]
MFFVRIYKISLFCLILISPLCPFFTVGQAQANFWKEKQLLKAPEIFPAPQFESEGVKAFFFEGLTWQGKPTRIFAYYGVPQNKILSGLPGIILVHGGHGTAYAEWVKLWTGRGFAALALDVCGSTPVSDSSKKYAGPHPRNEFSGPPGWGGFDQMNLPLHDQWTYQAVADIILANSLLHSFKEIDHSKIGITGISWGGILTMIAAGVDHRFRFACPVYGSGFLSRIESSKEDFDKLDQKGILKWNACWDPSVYINKITCPVLWIVGTNDANAPLDEYKNTYLLQKSQRYLSIHLRMKHGHGGAGENPPEILGFANQVLYDSIPLIRIVKTHRNNTLVTMSFEAHNRPEHIELLYTTSSGPIFKRNWQSLQLDGVKNNQVSTELPQGTTAYFFNVTDTRGFISSTVHEEPGIPGQKM